MVFRYWRAVRPNQSAEIGCLDHCVWVQCRCVDRQIRCARWCSRTIRTSLAIGLMPRADLPQFPVLVLQVNLFRPRWRGSEQDFLLCGKGHIRLRLSNPNRRKNTKVHALVAVYRLPPLAAEGTLEHSRCAFLITYPARRTSLLPCRTDPMALARNGVPAGE